MKTIADLKASPLDDDAFRVLVFPFGGPIGKPGTSRYDPAHPRGYDLDHESFDERTDIKPEWLPFRPTDWHHRNDRTTRDGKDISMGREVIGKAIDLGRFDGPSKDPDDDGWWATVWLAHGARRRELIRAMAKAKDEVGEPILYGSAQTVPELAKKTPSGNLLVWPYWRQALSTSPQNTLSVVHPLKATLDDIEAAGERPGPSFWFDLEAALRSVAPSLRVPPFVAELDAKAGRVLSAVNENDLREALDALRAGLDRLDAVVKRQPEYQLKE